MFKLPSLTELFFGKGVDPATYRGENKAPAYLSGKGKKLNNNTEKAIIVVNIEEKTEAQTSRVPSIAACFGFFPFWIFFSFVRRKSPLFSSHFGSPP